LCECR